MSELEVLRLPEFNFGNPNCCTYCGDPAQNKDHVIAVSYQKVDTKHRFAGSGPWCWSCADCNLALSNKYFDAFRDRCEWCQWRLEAKAKPIEWHAWELAPLDYGLRSHVQSEMKKRKWYRQRADYYGSREFYLNLESLIWSVAQLRGGTIADKFMAAYFSSMLHDVAIIYRPQR